LFNTEALGGVAIHERENHFPFTGEINFSGIVGVFRFLSE
jgi:hypothetical protein